MEVGQMRGIWTRSGRDDGMTILEVMIAAAILFIVVTAVLSLVTQTMSMGMQAKEKTVFNNAVNSYVERVQSMDFDNVVIGTDPGQLASVETTTIGDYTVTITPTITAGATSDLKTLQVTATIQWGDKTPQTISTDVVIRDKSSFLTQGITGPAVSWTTALMPNEGEVVWASTKASGGVLWIAAEVVANEGTTISRVAITADNGWTLENTSGTPAIWNWDGVDRPETWSLTDFAWDTEQEGIIDAETLEVGPVIPDGLRTITIDVTDSAGGRTERTYTFVVDNNPPAPPGVPQMQITATGPTLTWAASSDGNDLAPGYNLDLKKRTKVIGWTDYVSVFSGAVTTNKYALQPFTRYIATVRAVGIAPNNRLSDPTAMTLSVITPPRASGTWTTGNAKDKGTVNLTVSPPDFYVRTDYTPKYEWYASDSPSGPWTKVGATATVNNLAFTKTTYYRCTVTLKPGYEINGDAMDATAFNSCVVGPTGSPKDSTGTLPEVWLP